MGTLSDYPWRGVDVASPYQSLSTCRALAGSGKYQFAIIKATEGLSYVNPNAASIAGIFRTAKMAVGWYHYAHVTQDAGQQVRTFLQHAAARPGELLCLDFEPYGQNVSNTRYAAWIVSFVTQVHAAVGCWPVIYLNNDMASQVVAHATTGQLKVIRNCPLWKAYYGSTEGGAYGWPVITLWQYNGTGIDLDAFNGNIDTWHALGVPGIAPKEDVFMALTDAQQADLYSDVQWLKARVAGMLPQRYYLAQPDGSVKECASTVKGARPGHVLDTLDGNYILRHAQADPAAIAAAIVKALPAGNLTAQQVQDAVVAGIKTVAAGVAS